MTSSDKRPGVMRRLYEYYTHT